MLNMQSELKKPQVIAQCKKFIHGNAASLKALDTEGHKAFMERVSKVLEQIAKQDALLAKALKNHAPAVNARRFLMPPSPN
jgi:hypothetical protein